MAINPAMQQELSKIGCEKCDGFGNIVTPEGVRPCECKIRAITAAHLSSASIPPMFIMKNFESFKPNTPRRTRNLKMSREFINNYIPGNRGLMFMGTCGTGKTHLAVSLLRELIQKGYSGLFYNVITLLDDLRATYAFDNTATQWPILDKVYGIDILVLDDLGAEKTSGWVNDRLYAIINHRYERKKTTLVTTNRDIPELREQIGERIYSRLEEMCERILFEGEDYRIQMMSSGKR